MRFATRTGHRAACAAGTALLVAVSIACGGGDRQSAPAEAQAGAASPASPNAPSTTGNAVAAGGAAAGGAVTGGAAAPQPTFGATLYFADAQGRLQPEARDIASGGQPAELARRVVQALVDGPGGPGGSGGPVGASGGRGAGLTAVIPADAALLEIYVGDDGTAYVDFDTAFARGLSAGSEDLLLAVWSITESLAANVPQVRRVQILVDGEETRDLGGHLDLSRPLVPHLAAR